MDSYTGFARVYETLMDNVPYDSWTEYIVGLLLENGVKEALVAELGCGTGAMTRRLAGAGYDMIGVDLSEEMLYVARYGHEGEAPDILYLNQDMRELELYGTVAAVVSLCDSMNYLTSEEDLLQVFRLVNNYLDEGGLFLFDMNTIYKYEVLLGDRVIAENRDDCSLIWENYYDRQTRLNQYDITIYVKAESDDDPWEASDNDGQDALEDGFRDASDEEDETDKGTGLAREQALPELYERLEETHLQRAYPVETVISLLGRAGMEFVAVYDFGTHNAPGPESERICFLAREKHQEGKYYGA